MSKPPSANFAREMENVVADICHAYGVTRDVVKGLCEELANLKAENAALREWVKEEGKRNDVCTYGILKEVCEDCRCGRRKEAQP